MALSVQWQWVCFVIEGYLFSMAPSAWGCETAQAGLRHERTDVFALLSCLTSPCASLFFWWFCCCRRIFGSEWEIFVFSMRQDAVFRYCDDLHSNKFVKFLSTRCFTIGYGAPFLSTALPSPLKNPQGLYNLMAIAFSPRCFATKKNLLTGCLNGISVSCSLGNEPSAL